MNLRIERALSSKLGSGGRAVAADPGEQVADVEQGFEHDLVPLKAEIQRVHARPVAGPVRLVERLSVHPLEASDDIVPGAHVHLPVRVRRGAGRAPTRAARTYYRIVQRML